MSNSPTNKTGPKDHHLLSASTVFGKEFILDRPEVSCFPMLQGWQNATGPADLGGMATGAPTLTEVAASGIASVFMADAGDMFTWLWPIPETVDTEKDMDFRLIWSQTQAAATGSCTWVLTYLPIVVGTTTIADPTTALDTTITLQADLGADIPQATAYGTIDGGTLSVTPGTDYLALKAESDVHTTITDVNLLDCKCRFYRKYV